MTISLDCTGAPTHPSGNPQPGSHALLRQRFSRNPSGRAPSRGRSAPAYSCLSFPRPPCQERSNKHRPEASPSGWLRSTSRYPYRPLMIRQDGLAPKHPTPGIIRPLCLHASSTGTKFACAAARQHKLSGGGTRCAPAPAPLPTRRM